MIVFSLLLNVSISERQRKWQARLVLLSWMVQCIVMSVLIQSTLTTCLVAPKYYQDIDTFEDLYKTNLKVYAPESLRMQMLRLFQDDKRLLQHLAQVPRNVTVFGEEMSWTNHYR